MQEHRGLITEGIEEAVKLERSPMAAGFMAGLKAALLGAPAGAGIQAVRGGNVATGVVLGALIPGILAGFGAAGSQKLENLNTEAMLRYHANNIKNREPMFFMPPRQQLGKYFSRKYNAD